MFNFFKKKEVKAPTKNVVACADGTLIDITTVADPIFAEKMMGDGFSVAPTSSKVCAPIDGEVAAVFPTGHAFGIRAEDGLEVLVHIGIDTVNMNGAGFKQLVKKGDKVHAGDPCVSVDFDKVKAAGYDTTIMNIFTGGFEGSVEGLPYGSTLKAGDTIINRD